MGDCSSRIIQRALSQGMGEGSEIRAVLLVEFDAGGLTRPSYNYQDSWSRQVQAYHWGCDSV